jgi:hypothetical protein
MIVDDELVDMWEEAIVACFKAQSWYLLGGTEAEL